MKAEKTEAPRFMTGGSIAPDAACMTAKEALILDIYEHPEHIPLILELIAKYPRAAADKTE